MTAQKERAAELVAEGKFSLKKISGELGIGLRTLNNWRTEQEFQDAITRYEKLYRQEIERTGLARQELRIAEKKKRHAMLRRLVVLRSKDPRVIEYLQGRAGKKKGDPEIEIGTEAGFVCVRLKGKEGDKPEFAIDTGLLAEFDQIETDLAIETGQYKQKHEISAPEGAPPAVIAAALVLTPQQVQDIEAKLLQLAKETK